MEKEERLKNIKYFFVLLFMLFVCDENNCEIFYILRFLIIFTFVVCLCRLICYFIVQINLRSSE